VTIDATTEPQPAPGSRWDRVATLIDERVKPEDTPIVRAFAAAYLHRIDTEEQSDPEPLFHEMHGLFGLVASRGGRPAAVRAFNPVLAEHGYEAPGSIVETNTDDLPYLVDSVSSELKARGTQLVRVRHPIIGTERDHTGRLLRVVGARDATRRESVMHFELDRHLSEEELADVVSSLEGVLGDVRRVVADFPAMTQHVGSMIEYARRGAGRYAFEDVNEAIAFLRWLLEGNFTFLGYREYEATGDKLCVVPNSGLGLLSETDASYLAEPQPVESLSPAVQKRIREGELLLITKTNRLSPVHRRERMDYVGVRWVSDDGETVGEARLLGLFTTKAYTAPAAETPLLNHRLRRLLESEDLIEGSHDHRAAVAIYSSFPKDDLLAASPDDLRTAIVTLLNLQADQVRLLGRRSADGRSASLVVAMPAERYTPQLAERLERLICEAYAADTVEDHLVVGEQFSHARIHFTVHAPDGLADVDFPALERKVIQLTRTWSDAVGEALAATAGRAAGRALASRWAPRFPDFYKLATEPHLAAHDIELLERLEASDEDFLVGLQNAEGKSGRRTRLSLYKRGGKVPLSDFLPILEHIGLRVHDERPTRLQHGEADTFIQNFGVLGPDGEPLDLEASGDRVADLIAAVRRGEAESDWLNRLVVSAGLDWRQVAVLRAYRTYRQRVGSRFGAKYEADAFAKHPLTTGLLVKYFELRFDPSQERDAAAEQALRAEIISELDLVESLDEDRILRDQLALVDATQRTNAFRPGRYALALKLRSGEVPGMPQPAPFVEIYVNHTELEGIHLRGGLVARGGLRWSDRLDFRTEVWGLMRAQMTKNAVIVPTGAKGGFIVKRRPEDPAELRAAVEDRYRNFIRALLDVTDNIVAGEVVHPEGVRVLDGEDPYFVVAADKGTATFSDIANGIAEDEYGFWLGDAFASGGSAGYDHKGLGITARGAWESVKRLFRELGMDPARDEFTAVGIGDMSGDVFGNGMLLSDKLKLVAAYDHRHVFIDPAPEPAASWAERKRLFELPRSSWADYSEKLISAGGGVFPRTAKSIPLTEAARAALGVTEAVLTPDEVIRAILRAPVDLLWNGGIGTIVKASDESDADARDRASDAIRVDGRDLRCRVVGEGGNLGFTQRGRIEFSAAGGRINADFIDNAGGVDCSDHEVNLKILLGIAESRGALDRPGRNVLLQAVADDVVAHVLSNNYRQARILSREVDASATRIYAYEDLMQVLEAEGTVSREAEALPSEQQLGQRRRANAGLHRPELAVLLANAKRSLTDSLLESDLIEDAWLERDLRGYFPAGVLERYGDLLADHRLRRELVATLVANEVVDVLGSSFVSRLATELGADPADVVRAYRVARDATGAVGRFAAIDALDASVDRLVEAELVEGAEGLVETITRWYLVHGGSGPLEPLIVQAHEGFERLEDALEGNPGEEAEGVTSRLVAQGVPATTAQAHALTRQLAYAPDVIVVAEASGREVEDVLKAFISLNTKLRFRWILDELDAIPASQRVQRWAVHALRDDARQARAHLVSLALAESPKAAPEEAVETFLAGRETKCLHLTGVLRSLSVDGADLAGLMVAVRELKALAD
jgi:glutamate dehydrogenase